MVQIKRTFATYPASSGLQFNEIASKFTAAKVSKLELPMKTRRVASGATTMPS